MNLFCVSKKNKYMKLIVKLFNSKDKNRDNLLNEAYIVYKKYCYEHNLLDDFNANFLLSERFIISSEPEIKYIDNNKVAIAIEHLREITFGCKPNDGISPDEVTLILDWVVQNSRSIISENFQNICKSSLYGLSDYTQALTLLPFENLNIPYTVNDTKHFNNGSESHSFGTVTFPVKLENTVKNKQYLIDITYRQFFTIVNSSYGKFYDTRKDIGPSAGFYVCITEEGKKFASELLKKGYIELTVNNARIYGSGFECEKLNINNYKDCYKIINSNGEKYINIINNKQDLLNYSRENVEFSSESIDFPKLVKR